MQVRAGGEASWMEGCDDDAMDIRINEHSCGVEKSPSCSVMHGI